MTNYLVLLRGINVGGNNLLPMKTLVPLLELQHFTHVTSYLQTGNILLCSEQQPTEKIASLIEHECGFRVDILSLRAEQFLSAVQHNPYSARQGNTIHLYFCADKAVLNHAKIEQYIAASEQYQLIDKVFYLYAPDGIGRSKLVANIELCLGTKATGRNLNTVNKLVSLLEQMPEQTGAK
jgi:uncharacterized protein (DUF1697 family)